MAPRLVGIDLGTTNTVIAVGSRDEPPRVQPLAQLVGPSEVASRDLLPSVLFAPLPSEHVTDPFGDAPFVVGEHARARGRRAPGRAITSAKSWLSHAGVDRLAPVLPWGADPSDTSLPRISPVDATRRILLHAARAFETATGAPLAAQEIVLTVPASFDPSARELTLRAARDAGLTVRLLEEPLAAFYAYLGRHGTAALRALVEARDEATVLVCDVGGGTTDLTLVRVRRGDGEDGVRLDRVAVGRHLLLGGDNMDLALAALVEASLVAAPDRLDPALFVELTLACRAAKERLLGESAEESAPIRILPQGSSLVGRVLTAELRREDAERTILDGFFPVVERDVAITRSRTALVGFGLRYEPDPAVTRHVAAFVRAHVPDGGGPHAVLLNGGVFHSPGVRARLLATLERVSGSTVTTLLADAPDLAVARGAAEFARALHGVGPRVGGGSPRSYYVGLAAEGAARRAVCVVPRGATEGERHLVRVPGLSLIVGEPVRFDLFTSDTRVDAPGAVVTVDDSIDALPSMTASFDAGAERGRRADVKLEGELSAVGTLELACVESDVPEPAPRHHLGFDLRGAIARPSSIPPRSQRAPDAKLDAARALVESCFGRGKADADPRVVKNLVRECERLLGERHTWTTETARALFDALVPEARARKRSPEHERVFWLLAGYCLRPGYGHPKDDERTGRVVPLFQELVTFPDESRSFQQFFIAFRRAAGGLLEPAQVRIRDLLDPFLSTDGDKPKKKKGFKPLAEDEMLELAASLERVPPARRADLGRWVLERTWTDRDPRLWTAIGRIGARAPTYGSAHQVVPTATVEKWLDHLLREKWNDVPTAARAALDLGRCTGDRTRDIGDSLRRTLAERMEATGAPPSWVRAVREVVPVEAAERGEFFGESLPIGLVLAPSR